jgi:hypothetical protein
VLPELTAGVKLGGAGQRSLPHHVTDHNTGKDASKKM